MVKNIKVSIIILLVFLFILPTAQQCDQQAEIINDTDIYSSGPTYKFGKGWQYGEVKGHITEGIIVYICENKKSNLRLGFSSNKWVYIAYWSDNQWHYGWIHVDFIQLLSLGKYNIGFGLAYANDIESPPDDVKPPPNPTDAINNQNSTFKITKADTWIFITLFITLLIGMAAKTGYDICQINKKGVLKHHIKNGLKPLFVAPIIFISVISTINLNIETTMQFVLLLGVAFQNGFFWQDVFTAAKNV